MDSQINTAGENRLFRNNLFNPNPTLNGWTSEQFLGGLRNPVCPRSGEFLTNFVGYQHRPEKRDVDEADANTSVVIEAPEIEDQLSIVKEEPYVKTRFAAWNITLSVHYSTSATKKRRAYSVLINACPGTIDD